MTFNYTEQVLADLMKIEKLQAHMLIDLFENRYKEASNLGEEGKVFKTGPFRVIFIEEEYSITVLRIVR